MLSLSRFILPILALHLLNACQPSLERQPKIRPLEEPRNFVEGTVLFSAQEKKIPTLSRDLILRGQERYQIYCSVCHGLTGAGDGLATQRGFAPPPAFASTPLLSGKVAGIEKLIAVGRGRMLGFSDRIPESDRYAIAAYVQVLVLRSHFPVKELTPRDLAHFTQEPK